MSAPLVLVCVWVVVTNVIAALPSRDHHWTAAYVLIATGLPLNAWVIWQHGFWIGLLVFLAGASMLHWPIKYTWWWLKRRLGKRDV